MSTKASLLGSLSAATAAAASFPAAAADDPSIHLFNIIALKPEAKEDFLPIMQANAKGSRAEDGNISFDVFIDPEHPNTILLFESWKSQDALDAHMEEPHLQAVGKALETAAAGDQISHRAKPVPGLPTYERPEIADQAGTRNVIVRFELKDGAVNDFVDAFAEAIPQSRAASGNILFDLYQVEEKPTEFVLYERWKDAASHEAHLAAPYSDTLGKAIDNAIAAPVERYQPADVAPD